MRSYQHKKLILLFIVALFSISNLLADKEEDNLDLYINLQDMESFRVGFSDARIDADNPAPAVSLGEKDMTTAFGVDNDGEMVMYGQTTVYFFWEVFSKSPIKVKVKMLGPMSAAGNDPIDWGCILESSTFPQDSADQQRLGYGSSDFNDGEPYNHERMIRIDDSKWIKSGSAAVQFVTENLLLNDPRAGSDNEFSGEFRVTVEVD